MRFSVMMAMHCSMDCSGCTTRTSLNADRHPSCRATVLNCEVDASGFERGALTSASTRSLQVHYDEVIANHIGPEPRVVGREAGGEASAGVHIGQPLSRERINWDADAVVTAEHIERGDRAAGEPWLLEAAAYLDAYSSSREFATFSSRRSSSFSSRRRASSVSLLAQ